MTFPCVKQKSCDKGKSLRFSLQCTEQNPAILLLELPRTRVSISARLFKAQVSGQFDEAQRGPLDAIFRNDMHGYLYPKLAVGYMRDITHMGGYTVRYIRACRGQIGQEGGVYPPLLQVSTHPSFPPCALWKRGGQILPKLKGSTKSSGSKKNLHL